MKPYTENPCYERRDLIRETAVRAAVIFCSLILLAALVFGVLPAREDSLIYGSILRLHVIADSDSEYDQALKLKVRDSVLELLSERLASCGNSAEAELVADQERAALVEAAEDVLSRSGHYCPVSVELGEEYYPTREYEGVKLPAGSYRSLRVIIGSGSGRNWWCVLFPALCTSLAAEPEEEFAEAGFTPGQIKVLTESENPRYVLRFRLLDFIGSVVGYFKASD